jgi:hypothetical protein
MNLNLDHLAAGGTVTDHGHRDGHRDGDNVNDSESIVAESYLTDYHVHKHGTHKNLSPFRKDLAEFTSSIANLGTIRKLVQLTNGFWWAPLQCAQTAMHEAGSQDFPYGVDYKNLLVSEGNDIEYVADQQILPLQWQAQADRNVPCSLFLYTICKEVFNQVFFLKKMISKLLLRLT